MIYLIVKMLVLLLIAAAIGAAFGWLMRGAQERETRAASEAESAARLAELRAARDAAEAKLAATLAVPAADAEPDLETTAELDVAAKKLEESDVKLKEAAAALQAAEARAATAEAADNAKAATLAKAEQRITELESAGTPAPAASIAPVAPHAPDAATAPAVDPNADAPPPAIAEPEDGGDDLRQISGVGPKIELILHAHGIWRFSQIAEMTPDQVAWLDDKLTFRGRIEREDWIGQAKTLAGDA